MKTRAEGLLNPLKFNKGYVRAGKDLSTIDLHRFHDRRVAGKTTAGILIAGSFCQSELAMLNLSSGKP